MRSPFLRTAAVAMIAASLVSLASSPSSAQSPQDPISEPPKDVAKSPTPVLPLRCLIVGGGPSRDYNQVAIESNVRYVRSLLRPSNPLRVLYANGNLLSRNVQYQDKWGDIHYRSSILKHIDGPAGMTAFKASLKRLTTPPTAPLLLYFTGHGSPDRHDEYKDNAYDFWGGDILTVANLTANIKALDPAIPVTMVMVQCYSGAFADSIVAEVSPGHPVVRHNSCGFFASVAQQEAAGCTSEVDETNYHDFTTYFFGALSGHDRVGRPVTNADFDGDGVVEMDEACAYAEMHDRSIDTPVATSDSYVRRFTTTDNDKVFATSYAAALSYATPAQRAALEFLSLKLGLSGDNRLASAYAKFLLRTGSYDGFEPEEEEDRTALWIRFVRIAKSVVLEHEIDTSGTDDVKAGLNELLAAEHTNPLFSAQMR